MKKLNKTAAIIFNHLVAMLGEQDHIKVDNSNGTFMPVSFDFLHDTKFVDNDAKVFAMAHYFEQNGDLVPDPDMTFIQLVNLPEIIYPASITTQFGHRQSIWKGNGVWKINRKEQADQTIFANQWLLNIKDQQQLQISLFKQVENFVNSANSGDTKPRDCFRKFLKN
jgi:hypothetical protein